MIAMQPSLTVLKIETFSFSGGSTVFTYQETYTMTPRLYFNPSQLTRLTTLRPSHVTLVEPTSSGNVERVASGNSP